MTNRTVKIKSLTGSNELEIRVTHDGNFVIQEILVSATEGLDAAMVRPLGVFSPKVVITGVDLAAWLAQLAERTIE